MTDFDGIAAAAEILEALGIFSQVDAGLFPTGNDPTPSETPYCWIRPATWETVESWSDASGEVRRRRVTFEVEIQSRQGEGPPPEQLSQAVEDALHGHALAGSLPALTRVESGTYSKVGLSKTKQHILIIRGEFSYLK